MNPGRKCPPQSTTSFQSPAQIGLIEQTSNRGQHCITIFLDVDGAFNKTNLDGVVKAMRENDYPETFVNWYEAFVMNQIASVDTGMTACKRRLTLGVPQGSLTSPHSWNVYFESILEEANAGPAKVVGFADDSSMSFAGPDLGTVQQIAQYTISRIVEYGKDLDISFNPGKTEVMHFGKDPEPDFDLKELIMNGHSIPYSEEVTYLGMKLNRKLDWSPHVDAKIKVAKRKLMQLHSSIGK